MFSGKKNNKVHPLDLFATEDERALKEASNIRANVKAHNQKMKALSEGKTILKKIKG